MWPESLWIDKKTSFYLGTSLKSLPITLRIEDLCTGRDSFLLKQSKLLMSVFVCLLIICCVCLLIVPRFATVLPLDLSQVLSKSSSPIYTSLLNFQMLQVLHTSYSYHKILYSSQYISIPAQVWYLWLLHISFQYSQILLLMFWWTCLPTLK